MMKHITITTTRQSISTTDDGATRIIRRGIAMLLVLIALAVVTVSTTAFLNSRMNAPEVGKNVAKAIEARAAAETGIDLADKIINDPTVDWRTLQVNGVLLDNYDFGGGTITIRVTDLQGNPPDANTQDIILTSDGQAQGLIQSVEAEVHVPPSNPTVDVDLSEFAVFGSDTVVLDNGTITPWKLSPDYGTGKPVKIGTNSNASLAVKTYAGTKVANGEYFVRSGASSSTLSDTSGSSTPLRRKTISEANPIPVPASQTPITTGLPKSAIYTPILTSGTLNISTSKEYGTVTLKNTADLIVTTPGTTFLVTGDLNLINGGDIIISAANVNVVVLGNVAIGQYSTIEVQDGASLRLFVGGNLDINRGVLGLPDTLVYDANRHPAAGIAAYQDPERVKVFKIDGSPSATWKIRGKSYAAATLYGPNASIDVDQQSAVFGNLVATSVTIRGGSKLFYDPKLDSGWGYTNPDSFVYDGTGNYDTNVTSGATDLNDVTYASIINYVKTVSSHDGNHSGWKKSKKKYKKYGMKTKHDDDD